jgi:hypothetical protein
MNVCAVLLSCPTVTKAKCGQVSDTHFTNTLLFYKKLSADEKVFFFLCSCDFVGYIVSLTDNPRRSDLEAYQKIIVQKYSFIHQWLCSPLLDSGRLSCFVILYIVDTTRWTGDQPVARPHQYTSRTLNTRTHTDIHASSGIRTHYTSARAGETSSMS